MELEAEKRLRQEEEDESGRGWNRVEIDETPVDIGVSDFFVKLQHATSWFQSRELSKSNIQYTGYSYI